MNPKLKISIVTLQAGRTIRFQLMVKLKNSSRKDTEENFSKKKHTAIKKSGSRMIICKDDGNMKLFLNSYDCSF